MIEVEYLTVRAGDFGLENISFEVPAGKYAVLMGRTGAGKTTLLEAICGLKRIESGAIRLHGEDATEKPPGARGIGFVPQDGALFATKTVREHLAFAPRIRGWKPEEIRKRVDELAEDLGIQHLLDRKPRGLSGGEIQRVALGRALSFRPTVLCLDEPLSSLDEETRGEMSELLKKVAVDFGGTVLQITHSSSEADAVGDLRLRIEKGSVVVA